MKHGPLTRLSAWVFACILIPTPLTAEPTPGWPSSSRASEGVLWFWGGAKTPGDILDDSGGRLRMSEGLLRGDARFSWFQGVNPAGGFLEAADAGPVLARAIMETPALHLEMALHPPREGQAEGLLAWIGDFGDELTWGLMIREGRLTLQRAGEVENVDLGEVDLKVPRHLALTLTPDQTRVRWDGGEAKVFAGGLLPVLPDEWDVVVCFGGAPASKNGWTGELEYLFLSTREPADAPHARAWRAAFAKREAPGVWDVVAELRAHAVEPDENTILEYHNTLLALVWVLKEGEVPGMSVGDEFLSWNWYSLDRRIYEPGRPPPVGGVRRLRLSPAEMQPQLEGVQKISAPLEEEEMLLLPEWFLIRSQAQ